MRELIFLFFYFHFFFLKMECPLNAEHDMAKLLRFLENGMSSGVYTIYSICVVNISSKYTGYV